MNQNMHGIQIVNVIGFNVIPLALVKSIFIGQNRGPYNRELQYLWTIWPFLQDFYNTLSAWAPAAPGEPATAKAVSMIPCDEGISAVSG